MVGFYVFLLIVAAVGAGAYLFLFLSHVPGAADERLGEWEPLPENLDTWGQDEELSEDGLIREWRHLSVGSTNTKFVLQVRYRNPDDREIIRVEPEIQVRRRRRKRAKN